MFAFRSGDFRKKIIFIFCIFWLHNRSLTHLPVSETRGVKSVCYKSQLCKKKIKKNQPHVLTFKQ